MNGSICTPNMEESQHETSDTLSRGGWTDDCNYAGPSLVMSTPHSDCFNGQSSYTDNMLSDLTDFGSMEVQVDPNRRCVRSDNTGYHLVRSTGILRLRVMVKGLDPEIPLTVRGMLVRAKEEFRGIPVSFVCNNHANEAGAAGRQYVLQASADPLGRVHYCLTNGWPTVLFNLGYPSLDGTLDTYLEFRSICSDSCVTHNNLLVRS